MGSRIRAMNPIAAAIADAALRWRTKDVPLIIGICGPQASGKSTAVAQVAAALTEHGLGVATLSLDDLYLGRGARAKLAAHVHPLLATRGPPGTHDAALGVDVLNTLKLGKAVTLPRFDKGRDEPFAKDTWPTVDARCDVVLFEGWCVGARPQGAAALVPPVNALERDEDADGVWRRTINAHLAGPTGDLFARVDRLILLRAPGFDVVHAWRCEQEHDLIAKAGQGGAPAAMSDDQIARFVAHFERITRHIADEMPARADLVIDLDRARNVVAVRG
jgi:D-glycerate 3-kinase